MTMPTDHLPTETLGTPSASLAVALDAEISDSRIAKALGDALTATQTTRSGTVEPDHKTRMAAAQIALAYRHGRPIERQQVVTAKIDSESDLLSRLVRSPAAKQALKDLLAAAESAGDAQTAV